MLVPDREDNLEYGKLNPLTKKEVVTHYFLRFSFPWTFIIIFYILFGWDLNSKVQVMLLCREKVGRNLSFNNLYKQALSKKKKKSTLLLFPKFSILLCPLFLMINTTHVRNKCWPITKVLYEKG